MKTGFKVVQANSTRGLKLLQELLSEIYNKEQETGMTLLKPCRKLKMNISTFKSVRVFGNCHQSRVNNTFEISLNDKLVQEGTDKEIKNVLMHELCHTHAGCFNHKTDFKCLENRMYYYTGYKSDTTPTCLKRPPRKERVKYLIKCKNCGKEFYRIRKLNVNNYHCASCKGRLELIEL